MGSYTNNQRATTLSHEGHVYMAVPCPRVKAIMHGHGRKAKEGREKMRLVEVTYRGKRVLVLKNQAKALLANAVEELTKDREYGNQLLNLVAEEVEGENNPGGLLSLALVYAEAERLRDLTE